VAHAFLPEGFALEEADDKILPVTICQGTDEDPPFTVEVRVLPIKEYRAVYNKLNRGTEGGGFRQNKDAQDKVDRDYLNRVVKGWSGLTAGNWNYLVRDGKKLVINASDSKTVKSQIVYSQDAAFYLYRNTWPQDFGNKIFETVQAGALEQEEEEEELKKA
jgi:hypothetical protein